MTVRMPQTFVEISAIPYRLSSAKVRIQFWRVKVADPTRPIPCRAWNLSPKLQGFEPRLVSNLVVTALIMSLRYLCP